MSDAARRGRLVASAAAALLLIAGVTVVVIALRAQTSAPQPPASAARRVNVIPARTAPHPGAHARVALRSSRSVSPSAEADAVGAVRGPVLPRSVPLSLWIPAIGVSSPLQRLGLDADGTVQVPPLSANSHAGWYKYSPTPGQVGPSLILGHIDSAAYGPGVFFRLGDLRQRDKIFVSRADGSTAIFEVERVVEYPKAHFPTLQVYGNTDHAALRLITCGGSFNFSEKSYEDNIVAYASLVAVRHGQHRKESA